MTAEETIEERLKKLAQAISPDETLVENVMSRIDCKSIIIASEVTVQNIWRTMMKSPITKLAIAAATVVAFGIGIHFFTGVGTTPAYGITDMPELFRMVRTVHLKGWHYYPGHKTPDGNDVPPVNMEEWFDLENGRRWSTTCSSCPDTFLFNSGRTNVTKISVGEMISDGHYRLRLNHTWKTAHFSKINKYEQMLAEHQGWDQMIEQLFGDISKLDDFVKIGRERIDGVDCDIWEREEIFSDTKHRNRYRYWLSPSKGECKRRQFWMRFGDKQQWELRREYDKIERDVDIPEGLFSMEVPEGYEADNTKETATLSELGSSNMGGYGDDRCSLSWGAALSFTMSDGSVIWGWNSIDRLSEKPQEEFFEGLEFGGLLPKLPIEFNTLKPAGEPKDITYTGYHLAYTWKADRFTEWAVYVPDGTPPENVKQFGYHALYVFNLEHEPRLEITLPVPYGLLIETKEDFDKWVLGAMAELSDDGKAPENVTYESVLQLTKRIREPITQ
ncbi:MAG: hypothetical protein ACETWQ_00370 [Phycisphaerae bacterium]